MKIAASLYVLSMAIGPLFPVEGLHRNWMPTAFKAL